MKRSQFTEQQITYALEQQNLATSLDEILCAVLRRGGLQFNLGL